MSSTMSTVELLAREAGAYESVVDYLAGVVDQADLTDAEFRALARRELAVNRSRIAELLGEPD